MAYWFGYIFLFFLFRGCGWVSLLLCLLLIHPFLLQGYACNMLTLVQWSLLWSIFSFILLEPDRPCKPKRSVNVKTNSIIIKLKEEVYCFVMIPCFYIHLCVSSYARVSELLGLFWAWLPFELAETSASVITVIFEWICDFGPWK